MQLFSSASTDLIGMCNHMNAEIANVRALICTAVQIKN